MNQLESLRGMPKKNLSHLGSRGLCEGVAMLDYVSRMEIYSRWIYEGRRRRAS